MTDHNWIKSAVSVSSLKTTVEDLHPAYFAMVMATGIVSIAANLYDMRILAVALFWLNVLAFALLWLMTWPVSHGIAAASCPIWSIIIGRPVSSPRSRRRASWAASVCLFLKISERLACYGSRGSFFG